MEELKLNDIVIIKTIESSGFIKGIWQSIISADAYSTQYQVRYISSTKQIIDDWFLREELTKV